MKLIPSKLQKGDMIRKKKSKDKIILEFVEVQSDGRYVFTDLENGFTWKLYENTLHKYERLTP